MQVPEDGQGRICERAVYHCILVAQLLQSLQMGLTKDIEAKKIIATLPPLAGLPVFMVGIFGNEIDDR